MARQDPAPVLPTTCAACGESVNAPAYRILGTGEWRALTDLCGPCERVVANALAEGVLTQLRGLTAPDSVTPAA